MAARDATELPPTVTRLVRWDQQEAKAKFAEVIRRARGEGPQLVTTRGGKPVHGADVIVQVTMLDMEMGPQEFRLRETAPGVYSHAAPVLVMVGHWGLAFDVTPAGGQPLHVQVVDHATG